MTRRTSLAALIVALAVGVLPAQEGASPHAYFDALVARADHWKSYSLRDPAQLARPSDGGYANSNSGPLAVTYDPANDRDPNRQDAAKVVIPPFQEGPGTKLAAGIDAGALTLHLSDLGGDVTRVSTSFNAKGRQIKIGDEIIISDTEKTPLDRATGIVTLSQRGAYGTTAKAHAAGTYVALGGNSLSNQVRVPFDSHDGATWFITWDGYFTDSYMDNGIGFFKAFQLTSGKSIWLEPQINFNGGMAGFDRTKHVGTTGQVRAYQAVGGSADWSLSNGNQLGPVATKNSPIEPTVSPFFTIHPNRWVRWWIRIEQRANDYDLMDLWMADEATGPVQIYSGIPMSVRPTDGVDTINQFYVEFNTSTAQLAPGRTKDFRDLVAYVRNIAILKNPPSDVSELLVRPGADLSTTAPSSPKNLRVLGIF